MQVIFTVLKVVLRGPFFPQLESILVVKRLLSHPKAMAELEQTWQDMPTCSKPQSCLALCQPMDCSPPGSSVYGISQARILECIAFPFPGDLPYPGIKPASLVSPALAGEFFTNFDTWEVPWQDMKQKMEAPWFPFQSLFHETFSNKLHSKQNKNFSVGKQIQLITFFMRLVILEGFFFFKGIPHTINLNYMLLYLKGISILISDITRNTEPKEVWGSWLLCQTEYLQKFLEE